MITKFQFYALSLTGLFLLSACYNDKEEEEEDQKDIPVIAVFMKYEQQVKAGDSFVLHTGLPTRIEGLKSVERISADSSVIETLMSMDTINTSEHFVEPIHLKHKWLGVTQTDDTTYIVKVDSLPEKKYNLIYLKARVIGQFTNTTRVVRDKTIFRLE